MIQLYEQANLKNIVVHDHISDENVDIWSNNGAISEERREAIRNMYRNGSTDFLSLHSVQSDDSKVFVDKMLFAIVVGQK
jgi:hypothetical protein